MGRNSLFSSLLPQHFSMGTKNSSTDLEKGKSSDQSESHRLKSSESTKKEAKSKYKYILQRWAHKIVMLPFEIAIPLLAASWSTQNGNGSISVCSTYHLFFLLLMLGFYSSVIGIILWPVFPKVARGFYLISFVCVLLSLTIFFASLLPNNLQDVPWICLSFLFCVVFGVAVYEECIAPG